MSRIAERRLTKHDEEIGFFNALIIDLKKLQLGIPPDSPVDMERLNEATRVLAQLETCKEPIVFR